MVCSYGWWNSIVPLHLALVHYPIALVSPAVLLVVMGHAGGILGYRYGAGVTLIGQVKSILP